MYFSKGAGASPGLVFLLYFVTPSMEGCPARARGLVALSRLPPQAGGPWRWRRVRACSLVGLCLVRVFGFFVGDPALLLRTDNVGATMPTSLNG